MKMTVSPMYPDWTNTDTPGITPTHEYIPMMSPAPIPAMYIATPDDYEVEKIKVEVEKPKPKEGSKEYMTKYFAKHKAKNKVKTRFKVGRYYFLRIKPKDGSANVVIKYQCVKTVYSIKDIEMNIVIMKQITPYPTKKFTLDKHECAKFHIKFQTGLEVWPMNINWIPEKNSQKD